MFDTSFPGLLLAPHDPVDVAFSVAPTKRGPDMVTLLDGLRTFVLDFRHVGLLGLRGLSMTTDPRVPVDPDIGSSNPTGFLCDALEVQLSHIIPMLPVGKGRVLRHSAGT